MRGSWKIARIAGIDIFMHWTFLILVGWILLSGLGGGDGLPAVLTRVGFIFAIFACVVMHEFGHALTARRYGIPTRDITLLPIGGVARLERMPSVPIQELWVALAGPAVNVVIVGVLGVLLLVLNSSLDIVAQANSFLGMLLVANVILIVFNLLPAFPMDGGRALRAILAMGMDYVRATAIAAGIGQVMAVLFALVGLFGMPGLWGPNILMVFIAMFIFLGARSEALAAASRARLAGTTVRDAMMTDFRTLAPEDSLQTAVDVLLAGSQQDFPVLDARGFHGILFREDLAPALQAGDLERPVAQILRSDVQPLREDETLERCVHEMREKQHSSLPVVRDGVLVGLVTAENISELLMIRAARQNGRVPHTGRSLTTVDS